MVLIELLLLAGAEPDAIALLDRLAADDPIAACTAARLLADEGALVLEGAPRMVLDPTVEAPEASVRTGRTVPVPRRIDGQVAAVDLVEEEVTVSVRLDDDGVPHLALLQERSLGDGGRALWASSVSVVASVTDTVDLAEAQRLAAERQHACGLALDAIGGRRARREALDALR